MAELQEEVEELLCDPDQIKRECVSDIRDESEETDLDKLLSEDEFAEEMDTGDFDETSKATIVNWTTPATMRLIHYYKKFRPHVGTLQVKNLRRLFEIICQKVNKDMKSNYTTSNCENRWRVLQRKYKKYALSGSKNKRARHFEFAKEMAELVETYNNPRKEEETTTKEPEKIILGPKLLLYPNVVLNSTNSNTMSISNNTNVVRQQPNNMSPIIINSANHNLINKNGTSQNNSSQQNASSSNDKNNCKVCDAKVAEKYYERKLQIEKDRLALKKRQVDLYKEFQQKKLDEKMRKNRLLEERNQLLRDYLRNNVNIPQILTDD